MGTFDSWLEQPDLHQHPAICSTAVLVDFEDEDPERLERFAGKNLPKSWHMHLVQRQNSRDFYVVLFYGALGAWPADHNKRWRAFDYKIDTEDQTTWRRRPLCDHNVRNGRNATDGRCDMPIDKAHDKIDEAMAEIRDPNNIRATVWYMPNNVREDGVPPSSSYT